MQKKVERAFEPVNINRQGGLGDTMFTGLPVPQLVHRNNGSFSRRFLRRVGHVQWFSLMPLQESETRIPSSGMPPFRRQPPLLPPRRPLPDASLRRPIAAFSRRPP